MAKRDKTHSNGQPGGKFVPESIEPSKGLPELDGHYAVMLPCTPETFGDFISGLLGKPQTIEKKFRGPFEIGHEEIINLFHIVDQRIKQQNLATLIQFVVVVGYDDASTTRFDSFSDFNSYAEIGSKTSISISMTWIYLIEFPERPAPEKQEINVRFETSRFVNVAGRQFLEDAGNAFQFSINHTVRSWGVDIEHLLTIHLESLRKLTRRMPARGWLGQHSGKAGAIFGFLVFFGSLAGLVFFFEAFGRSRIGFLHDEISNLEGAALYSRAAILTAEEVFQGRVFYYSLYSILFVVVAATISVIFGAWISELLDYRPASYLLLTRSAIENREAARRKEEGYWWRVGGAFAAAILTGVVSNYVFAYLVGLTAPG